MLVCHVIQCVRGLEMYVINATHDPRFALVLGDSWIYHCPGLVLSRRILRSGMGELRYFIFVCSHYSLDSFLFGRFLFVRVFSLTTKCQPATQSPHPLAPAIVPKVL